MKVVDVSTSMKPILASKVESTSKGKGKEVIRDSIPTSDDEKSESMETEDEMPIQFGTIPPHNFSVNMAFTLPAMLRAKEGQAPTIKGDVEEGDTPAAEMIIEGSGSKKHQMWKRS